MCTQLPSGHLSLGGYEMAPWDIYKTGLVMPRPDLSSVNGTVSLKDQSALIQCPQGHVSLLPGR